MEQGYKVFPFDPAISDWVTAALPIAVQVAGDPAQRAQWLRHDRTWFVGVDALPNEPDGSIDRVPLRGDAIDACAWRGPWHAAQVSVTYPGYPGKDGGESDANHRFRHRRRAAHVDGLLPEGPEKRRFLREPHAFVLGLPLNTAHVSPLVVWEGSHIVMGEIFRDMMGGGDPSAVDITDAYKDGRRKVFETCEMKEVIAKPGEAIWLHRHLLHGIEPWQDSQMGPPEGRIVAYFRPQFDDPQDWLNAP